MIGNKLVELRKKENLTQEQLAEKIGVSRQTISKWELGETAPDIKQAKKIADILNVNINDLIGNFNDMILDKVISNETKTNKISKVSKIVAIILGTVLTIEMFFLIFMMMYTEFNSLVKQDTKIAITCEKPDLTSQQIIIQYDDTNDILMTDGSLYIHENIVYKKEYTNTIELVVDIYNHFKNEGGFCK